MQNAESPKRRSGHYTLSEIKKRAEVRDNNGEGREPSEVGGWKGERWESGGTPPVAPDLGEEGEGAEEGGPEMRAPRPRQARPDGGAVGDDPEGEVDGDAAPA